MLFRQNTCAHNNAPIRCYTGTPQNGNSNRGCDDKDSLPVLIHNFCAGNGKLSDMDALRADTPTVSLLGLEDVRCSKRMGEYLALFNADAVKALYSVARNLCQQVAPEVIKHFVQQKGYLPLFSMAQRSKSQAAILNRQPLATLATDNIGFTIYLLGTYESVVV